MKELTNVFPLERTSLGSNLLKPELSSVSLPVKIGVFICNSRIKLIIYIKIFILVCVVIIVSSIKTGRY